MSSYETLKEVEMDSQATPPKPAELGWHKSSFSLPNGQCVEAATDGTTFYVRDSKDPSGPQLAFTRSEWGAFLLGAKGGEFDNLA